MNGDLFPEPAAISTKNSREVFGWTPVHGFRVHRDDTRQSSGDGSRSTTRLLYAECVGFDANSFPNAKMSRTIAHGARFNERTTVRPCTKRTIVLPMIVGPSEGEAADARRCGKRDQNGL